MQTRGSPFGQGPSARVVTGSIVSTGDEDGNIASRDDIPLS
jgi:hypothetical protein